MSDKIWFLFRHPATCSKIVKSDLEFGVIWLAWKLSTSNDMGVNEILGRN